jgi:hypothetical protein
VYDLGFRVQGSGHSIQGIGFALRGSRLKGLRSRIYSCCTIEGLWLEFWVESSFDRVKG